MTEKSTGYGAVSDRPLPGSLLRADATGTSAEDIAVAGNSSFSGISFIGIAEQKNCPRVPTESGGDARAVFLV